MAEINRGPDSVSWSSPLAIKKQIIDHYIKYPDTRVIETDVYEGKIVIEWASEG